VTKESLEQLLVSELETARVRGNIHRHGESLPTPSARVRSSVNPAWC